MKLVYMGSLHYLFSGCSVRKNPERLSNYYAFGWKGDRMIYFTSDLHFGHSGIITMQNRPFSDTAEMNRTLLRNYNVLIHRDDTVYILDVNEQAQTRLECIIAQMKVQEGVTEDLKRQEWWRWVQSMGSIQNRAEEIVMAEIIYS